MKKIICMGDILYSSEKQNLEQLCSYFKIFYPMIRNAVDDSIDVTFNITDKNGNKFSREHFFGLNNETNLKNIFNQYDVSKFTEQQTEYLKEFFDENTIILGFELYKPLCDLLTSFGCKVIDFAFHSFKLFNDNTFAIYTNDINVYNQLQKYKVPQEKFYYYANYWKVFMQCNGLIEDSDLEDKSAIFIGQTLHDKSVEKEGKFLNVTDFEDKLKEFSKKYSKIYYLPHPYLGKYRKMIYEWIKKSPYIELLTKRSTYGLMASDKIKKIIGISTSVLYEAQYFDKEAEYLFKPLFNIDVSFEEYCYTSIHEDCWNPKFWADILSPVCEIKPDVKDINYFKGQNNMIRNIRDTYWGYAQLDPIKRIPTVKESIKDLYRQYIAPHF